MIAVTAPAKVNLCLHVNGRRADGYHLLQSLVVFADRGDVLRAEPSGALTLSVTGPFAPALAAEHDNLVSRAARALGKGRGAAITLEKRLPVGAGLGGGSADAAAALTLLSRLWALPDDKAALQPLAASLGSDVPVCLHGKPCWMEGVGERITKAVLPFPLHLVLANPGVPLSTVEVFARVNPPYSHSIPLPERFSDRESLLRFLTNTRNDLEAPAIAALPVIAEVLAALRAAKGCALSRMSGSGATCFGIFPDEASANAGAVALSAAHPAWWVRAVWVNA